MTQEQYEADLSTPRENPGGVRLVWVTPDAERLIAYCARVSSSNQDNPEYMRLLRYCAQNGHWSVFEMASMCIEVQTTRMVSAQLLRHRSFSFQEFSQRYQEAPGIQTVPARSQDAKNRQASHDNLDAETQHWWLQAQGRLALDTHRVYREARERGIAKECARAILPMATTTKLYMSGTIRSWIHYLEVRLDPSTQLEHREIAEAIAGILKEQCPIVYTAAVA
jgi:thymidylate synthase (FAD)